MTKPAPEEIASEIATAWQFLGEAEEALKHNLLRAATSQSYYAMLHMARALLAIRGTGSKTHKGTIRLFGQHLVNTGAVAKEYGQIFVEAHDDRELADYLATTGSFDVVDVSKLVAHARKFVEEMDRLAAKGIE